MRDQSQDRARRAIGKLNYLRHKQGKQIDILCNDMVSAHKDFIKELRTLTYAVDFYEVSLGCTDLPSLLGHGADYVKAHVAGSDVTFFVLDNDEFETHRFGDDQDAGLDLEEFEGCFSGEVVQEICRMNKVCTLNDMVEIGLQGNPNAFAKMSAVAVPLGRMGQVVGFILITRNAENDITAEDLADVVSIAPGLANSIKSLKQLALTANK